MHSEIQLVSLTSVEDKSKTGGNSRPFHTMRGFSGNEKWFLLFVTLIGSIVRILYLHNRPFFGDEVGTLIYIKKDVPYLLSHFADWISNNYFIVFEKFIAFFFGKGPFTLRFISLAAGIVTIPLTAILALRFTSSRVAIISATLISMNPYLIRYSGIIRSYSLLAALSILVMILFFEWQDVRNYKYGVTVGVGCYILVLSHPNGVYTIAYVLFYTAAGFFYTQDRKKFFSGIMTLLLPLSISLLLIIISYAGIFPEMLQYGLRWHDNPPTSISYLPYIFTQYFSGGFYAWFSAAFFIAGVLMSYKYDKPLAILLPGIFLPMILISIQGLSHFPWGYARFLIFIVPITIIFMAEGIDHYARKFFPRRSLLPVTASVILLILSWTPQIRQAFDQKSSYPWHKVADYITTHFADGDIIVGSDRVEPFHLIPYLSGKPYPNFQLNSDTLRDAAFSVNSGARIFFVTSAHFVETNYPSYYFGNVQVITYAGMRDQPVLRAIRDDLINTVKGGKEVAPELTSIYKNIWDINNQLGLDDNNFYYYNLWVKCFELTKRQRNIPRSLQIWEANNFLNTLR
jgi:hypothetical protein